ncbi:olfactory receptor 2AT4-like [Vombatus ursinus]|uniref:G-protein coupled receptors family 1 profile domain-containing protein n=1 Tax=Vombatus ursinus TaxID=29139 RepID=A0A4X2LEJ4_VOMUR|nr:olfactory receptor 2AT4-like [Vombatus ursinus]
MNAWTCNSSDGFPTSFYLMGIPSLPKSLFLPVFSIFLILYLLVITGNSLILVAVVIDSNLHKPMYFFLTNLSALDILFTTTTIPRMLSLFLLGDRILSFPACFLQMYFFHGFSCSEAFILVIMAYDRYEAICHPLHYTVHMTPQVNAKLAAGAWLAALLLPIPAVVQSSQMTFGTLAQVFHCFCDHLAVVQASCSDPTFQTFLGFCCAMAVSFMPLLLVVLSYARILISILKISSKEGRAKAFSTCTSHLLVVGTYYTSIAVAYVAYRADLPVDFHIMGNVVYAILTPVVNPLIYTLRNKDVKAAITKFVSHWSRGYH